jgi:hypothetical protein
MTSIGMPARFAFKARVLALIGCLYCKMSAQPSRIIYSGDAHVVYQDVFLSTLKHHIQNLRAHPTASAASFAAH